jgi:hypothetical protein
MKSRAAFFMRDVRGYWLAADAAASAPEPATALALLMLSIGVDDEDIALEAPMSGALAVVSATGAVVTSSFLVQPPRASCEARATARVRDSEIERFMADSSWM